MNTFGLVFIVVGIFSICGAAFNWDWFINHYKARMFVALLGRTGARIFYGILGAALSILGALVSMGLVFEQV